MQFVPSGNAIKLDKDSFHTTVYNLCMIITSLYEYDTLFGQEFFAFYFCRFCMVIRFFHPRHTGQRAPTSKDVLSQIVSITSLLLRKNQHFSFQC